MLDGEPLGVRDVVHDSAQRRVFEMGVEVDEAGHDDRLAEVAHLFGWMAAFQPLGTADFDNAAVHDENGAIFDGLRRDRDDVLGAE